jgi:hypothetical protein
MKETDRKFQETDRKFQETERLLKEHALEREKSHQKWKERAERLDKDISRLGNRVGDLVVSMLEGGIARLFENFGYVFKNCARGYVFREPELDIYGEIDLFLENGDFALLVEVKTKLSVDDVKEHVERLEKFRKIADVRGDKRRFIAAVGGGLVQENVQKFALRQGMFVIQQSGENVEVIPPIGEAKIW